MGCSNHLSPGAPAIAGSTGVFVAGNAVETWGSETARSENLRKGESVTSVGTSELESGWRYDEKVARKMARKDTLVYEPTAPTPEQTETAKKDPCPEVSKGQPAMEHETGNGPPPKPPMLAETAPEASTPQAVDSPPQDTEEPAETPQEHPQDSDLEAVPPRKEELGEPPSKMSKYDKWYHKIF